MQENAQLSVLQDRLRHDYVPLRPQRTCLDSLKGMLCENSSSRGLCQFDEHFLQALWNEQCFTCQPCTVSGQTVTVLSTGTWNQERGPDFRNAKIVLGRDLLCGDVEIHRHVRDWWHHGHGNDPLYSNVILHVVWDCGEEAQSTGLPPCLSLKDLVKEPWEHLSRALSADTYPYARKVPSGLCARQWVALDDDSLRDVLRIAGLARFHDKALDMEHRIIASGGDQSLYEALFRALGYKVNKEPFVQLARTVSLSRLRACMDSDHAMALLYGSGGLLPDPTRQPVCDEMRPLAHKLWNCWWRQGCSTQRLEWTRGSTRPLNYPERRLAAGVKLLERWEYRPVKAILGAAAGANHGKELLLRLRDTLTVQSAWCGFASFNKRLPRPMQLLGRHRIDDIIINVILPFLRGFASRRGDRALQTLADEAFVQAPKLQSNRQLKEIVHRILVPPSRGKAVVGHACEQQGLLGIYHDFCLCVDNACRLCPLADQEGVAKLSKRNRFTAHFKQD
ncbi:MAG: DUF2851 family protein [Candidatus Pacebacteria bacterium]|nr:DUF2851 family protein [Candidatus Paceibacterota bacterium]